MILGLEERYIRVKKKKDSLSYFFFLQLSVLRKNVNEIYTGVRVKKKKDSLKSKTVGTTLTLTSTRLSFFSFSFLKPLWCGKKTVHPSQMDRHFQILGEDSRLAEEICNAYLLWLEKIEINIEAAITIRD